VARFSRGKTTGKLRVMNAVARTPSLRTLALPTFGLAFAISVLTTYTPVLLGDMTSSGTAIGVAVGGEGAFALVLPLLVGSLSDRTRTRLGRRLPYALFGAPLLVAPLVLLPLAHSYAAVVGLVSLFFVGYFVYYPPYQALFAEFVPRGQEGRAQGIQGVARGLGLGGALVGGGVLLSTWAPLPFLLAAAALAWTTVALLRGVREPATAASRPAPRSGPGLVELLRTRGDLRAFVLANALWELSFMGLKTFIVLYVTKGLGQSVTTATAVIGVVAGSYVVAALFAGRLADRLGVFRVIRAALWVYGVGLLLAATMTSLEPLLLGLPFIALAGAVLMTLPYGLLQTMTPVGAEGAVAGLFGFSRGAGAVLGPVVVGAAIDTFAPFFHTTAGFGAMWVAIGVPIMLSLALLPAMERRNAPAPSEAAPEPALGFRAEPAVG
jgi:MFS family permease